MSKPEFIDNRGEWTLARALETLAQKPGSADAALDIATAYLNVGGFETVAGVLESRPELRLLIGAEPTAALPDAAANGSKPVGVRTVETLAELEARLAADRDALPFAADTAASVRRLERLLRCDTVAVRRYTEQFLHGKAYIFRGEAVVAGSNNLTAAGLKWNLELALAHYQPGIVEEAEEWFDELFDRSEDYRERLLAILTARELPVWTPYEIYLRTLLELYEDELGTLRDDDSFTPGQPAGVALADFQRHGYERAVRIIDRFGGALVADGVGLGKSFIGSQLLNEFVRERGLRGLVLVPAALRDSFWKRHVLERGIAVEVLSYQELASERQLGGDQRRLEFDKDNYGFVLVDEAHAFRNPDTAQYRALSRLMGGTRKKLALLTATPVNNTVFDLYHQVMLFARHNARFAAIGIPSLTAYFKAAVESAGNGSTESAMFALMDAVSVRRTRHFVQTYYPNARVNGKRLTFPRRTLKTVWYDLDTAFPGLFAQVQRDMQALTLARYQPDNYRLDGDVDRRAQTVAGLLRTGLLKRFESSVHAFRLTTQTMIAAHEEFLRELDRGRVLLRRGGDSSDEALDPARSIDSGTGRVRPAGEYRTGELRRHVQADLDRLGGFLRAVEDATPDDDPKLAELAALLDGGLGTEKVIVFSYYADTVDWIARAIAADPMRFGDRRFVAVTGSSADSATARLQKVHQFSPKTTADETGAPVPADLEKDLLLATDVLAEGQNLQQAKYIVNYDMPWNPMRLVQRNGRIDRIGSPFDTIVLVNLFPRGELNDLLKLYDILLRKIGEANVSVGMEAPVFEEAAAVEQNFGTTATTIQGIVQENVGVLAEQERQLDALSGEEFRMELRSALAHDRVQTLRAMPHGAGSGFLDQQIPAGTSGVAFVIRLLFAPDGRPDSRLDQRAWRYIAAQPPHDVIVDELTILKRIRTRENTPRVMPADAETTLFDLWARVRDQVLEEHNRRLDPAESGPQVPASHQWAIALLADQARAIQRAGTTAAKIQAAIASLSADRGASVQRMLGRIRQKHTDGNIDDQLAARDVLEIVQTQGLRPIENEIPSLPPLTSERVRLICWQLVHGTDK